MVRVFREHSVGTICATNIVHPGRDGLIVLEASGAFDLVGAIHYTRCVKSARIKPCSGQLVPNTPALQPGYWNGSAQSAATACYQ
jgi:hypothetical protein